MRFDDHRREWPGGERGGQRRQRIGIPDLGISQTVPDRERKQRTVFCAVVDQQYPDLFHMSSLQGLGRMAARMH